MTEGLHWNRICLCNTNDLLGPLPSLPFFARSRLCSGLCRFCDCYSPGYLLAPREPDPCDESPKKDVHRFLVLGCLSFKRSLPTPAQDLGPNPEQFYCDIHALNPKHASPGLSECERRNPKLETRTSCILISRPTS